MGLPWLLPRNDGNEPYLNNTRVIPYAMNISHFSNTNLTMEVSPTNIVSFRYKFYDFQGTNTVFAQREGLTETHCQDYDTTQGTVVPLTAGNFTQYYNFNFRYRWIFPWSVSLGGTGQVELIPLNETVQICMPGTRTLRFWQPKVKSILILPTGR